MIEFKEICLIVISIVGLLVVITLALVGLDYTIDKAECNAKANTLGYNHDYGYLTGCVLIKPDGKKVLLNQLRDFDR